MFERTDHVGRPFVGRTRTLPVWTSPCLRRPSMT